MKGKAFGFLAGFTIVLVIAAFITSRREPTAAPVRTGTTVLPDLPLNDIAEVVIETTGETTTLSRGDDKWVVASKHRYPADFGKLREQLLKLSDLKIGQLMRVDDAQKAELGITGTDRKQITLKDAEGRTLASLTLGDTRDRPAPQGMPYGGYPDGRFVSADNGQSVILVGDSLSEWLGGDMDWIDSELLNVPGVEILDIRLIPAEGDAVMLSRTGDAGALELTDLADGETVDNAKRQTIQDALSFLRAEDIVDPAIDEAALGFDKPDRFEAVTKDNLLYIVQLGGSPAQGAGRYCRIAVTAMEQPAAADKEAAADTDEPAAEADEPTRDPAELATALNARLAGWTFIIPTYKADAMVMHRQDLLKANETTGDAPTDQQPDSEPPTEEPTTETTATAPAADPQTADPAPAPLADQPAPQETPPQEKSDPAPDVTEAEPDESLGAEPPVVITVPEAPEDQK